MCRTAGSIHLFNIIGTLKPENIKLNKNYIWDSLEIDGKEVTVTFNDNKINCYNYTPRQNQNQMLDEERTFTLSPNG